MSDIEDALRVVQEYKPAVVWFFVAQQHADYAVWAKRVREASPKSQVWIQCGSVSAALQIARETHPDALCMQGADAGGHGFEKGASIISLLPETADALAEAGMGDLPLLASGGIVDGRGVAAALGLGAAGVVIGTRFLACSEALVDPNFQAAILEAQDGGVVTARSHLFDMLHGPNPWPEVYDGRSLCVRSYQEWKEGVPLEEVQKRHKEAIKEVDKGLKTGLEGRAAIWAGAGVGLVREVKGVMSLLSTLPTGEKEEVIKMLSRA